VDLDIAGRTGLVSGSSPVERTTATIS